MHKRRAILVLVLLGICTITTIAEAKSGTANVTWYFKDTNVSGFSHPSGHIFDKFMNSTEVPTGTADYTVTLGPGERAWWYANEAAECDLTIPCGEWTFHFWAETNSNDSERIYPRVVKVYENGSIDYITSKRRYQGIKSAEGIKEINYNVSGSQTSFKQGDRIAVEILFSADEGEWLKIFYNSTTYKSKLISPQDHYPIPEFPTLALPLAIVLGIVFFLFRRKREKK